MRPSTSPSNARPLDQCSPGIEPYYLDATDDADKERLGEVYEFAYEWANAFFNLFTTWVSYVDRICIETPGGASASFFSMTGGFLNNAFPNNRLSWKPVPGDPPLQLVAQVKGWHDDVWRVVVVNFEPTVVSGPTSRDVRLRFWHGDHGGGMDGGVNPFQPPSPVNFTQMDIAWPTTIFSNSTQIWLRATLSTDDYGGGDKPDNNAVTKTSTPSESAPSRLRVKPARLRVGPR